MKTFAGFSLRTLFSLWLLLGVFSGCGGNNGPVKVPVAGVVSLDGTPVPNGQIVFSDAAGIEQACAGEIVDGKFSFESTLGKKKVSISSMQEVAGKQGQYGGIQGDPVSAENPAMEYQEVIPAKYNADTELTAEVEEEGVNEFPFSLHSK